VPRLPVGSQGTPHRFRGARRAEATLQIRVKGGVARIPYGDPESVSRNPSAAPFPWFHVKRMPGCANQSRPHKPLDPPESRMGRDPEQPPCVPSLDTESV